MGNKNTQRANKHNALYTKQFVVRLRLREDADVIQHLDNQINKTDYLRNLILKDLMNSQEKTIEE